MSDLPDKPPAAPGAPKGLEATVHERAPEAQRAAAADPRLTEDLALTMLARRDLPGEVIEALTRNPAVMRQRRVALAIVSHPRTPRHIAVPAARQLYTFEMMQVALSPVVAADIKRAVEDMLIARLESVSAGERLSLARRASTRVAAALLCDPEQRVREAALANPHLTEAAIVRVLETEDPPGGLVRAVCAHAQWSLRREVQIALIRNPHTPLERALAYARGLPSAPLRELLEDAKLSAELRLAVIGELENRR